ncbi:hypothetical protein JCM24511_09107 [Saitozyma sp. JCM 24511]|uniref:Uncharacterized protein n=1 Tax=Saitozyma podzolica TaxID=1890683 RepID=A0A427Y7M6_9TREE|nr:hypothetical protein EHS25_003545 [Saitozyma podzolica]GFZ51347.1 hypothetical protein JCM24511_09107 [Saitozyma sp. JCM 24511]
MSLLANVLGFSAFGFGARCFQLGLQKRNMFEAPVGHLVAAGAFGAFGYYVYGAEQRQKELLGQRKKELLEIREKEQREWEASKAS